MEAFRYPYSKPGRRLARFIYGMNHKDQDCPITHQTCGPGFCCQCPTWQIKAMVCPR